MADSIIDNIDKLLREYKEYITEEILSPERLEKSQQLVQDVSRLLTNETGTTDFCVSFISNLTRVILDNEHTTSELQDFLLSPEVVKLVRELMLATGDAGVILQGLIEGVSEKGVGFQDIGNFNPKLLHSWFIAGDYKPKTQPGFLLSVFVFMYRCAERQQEICDMKFCNTQQVDSDILPLVVAALATETHESINDVDEMYSHTALHLAIGQFKLPSVTQKLLNEEHINVNVRDRAGRTPLCHLVSLVEELGTLGLQPFTDLLAHPDTDVSIADNGGRTPVEYLCTHLIKPKSNTNITLQMLQQICQHETVTPHMVQKMYEKILAHYVNNIDKTECRETLVAAVSSAKFDLTRADEDGFSPAHQVARLGDQKLIETILTLPGCDINIRDSMGNTPLFYIGEFCKPPAALQIIHNENISWDFTVKNKVDQTASDYCGEIQHINPVVKKILLVKQNEYDPVSYTLGWEINPPYSGADNFTVMASTTDYYKGVANETTYSMKNAYKGKACILSIPDFTSKGLKPLPGYQQDRLNLIKLWAQMGFEIHTTQDDGSHHLTAKELYQAVKEFAAKLTDTDLCAVLCILSYGGDSFLRGSDGGRVVTKDLVSCLDQNNCKAMTNKPKIVILHACPESTPATDVAETASSGNDNAQQKTVATMKLPDIADCMICASSMSGSKNLACDAKGSVFITALVRIFSENAHKDDILRLLVKVNKEMGVMLNYENAKQMSNFTSGLTDFLYLLPCPDGRDGQDWS